MLDERDERRHSAVMAPRPSPGRPTGKYTQAVRLFNLYHRLESAPAGISVEQLAEEFAVTTRSVRRDLSALRGAGQELEVVHVNHERRMRLARTGKGVEPVRMTRFQRYSLAAVRRVFDVLAGTPLHDDLAQLFAKLVPESETDEQNALVERLIVIPDAPKSYRRFRAQIYEAYDALLRSLTLQFVYQGGSTRGVRKLQPYALVLYRNGLYLVGNDVEKSAPRTFAVERMRRVRALAKEPFRRDPQFNVSKLFDGAFGLITGGRARRVVVEFASNVATYVEERSWHPSQRISKLSEGVRCEMSVAITEELVAWV